MKKAGETWPNSFQVDIEGLSSTQSAGQVFEDRTAGNKLQPPVKMVTHRQVLGQSNFWTELINRLDCGAHQPCGSVYESWGDSRPRSHDSLERWPRQEKFHVAWITSKLADLIRHSLCPTKRFLPKNSFARPY
jgi:hypothetical protein